MLSWLAGTAMKGVYVLVISVRKRVSVKVGALGSLNFEKGLYAYVGSAQNNLQKRIGRHLGKAKRMFWHIDYLLSSNAAKVVTAFFKEAGKREEYRIARELSRRGVAIEGFGSSDCKCESHLFQLQKGYRFLRSFMHEVKL